MGSQIRDRAFLTDIGLLAYSSILWILAEPRAVFDPDELPGTALLADRWQAVRAEFDDLVALRDLPDLEQILPGHTRLTGGNAWRIGVLRMFGRDVDEARHRCPETFALLDGVPDVVSAMFSVLEPGTAVPWHPGTMKGVIRCHLAIEVPDGDCGLQIGRRRHRWEEGEVFLFDDSYPHRVWNRTDGRRTILLLDLVRPMRWPWLDRINRRVIQRVGRGPRFANTVSRAGALVPPAGPARR